MKYLYASIAACMTLALAAPAPAGAACAGADPAIASVALAGTSASGGINNYTIKGRVVNVGRRGQASNTLQFVDMFQNDIRLDAKSIPPLKPGQSFTFTFAYQRSTDAGTGTSDLVFQIRMRQGGSSQNCSTANDRATLTI